MPAHASVVGDYWMCDTGYKRNDNQCVRFTVPAHASVIGNGWVCDTGYKQSGEQCIRFAVPANARVAENDWVCNAGYERSGVQCIRFAVPENARVVGNTWFCNAGFRQEGARCIQLAPAPDQVAQKNSGATENSHDAAFDATWHCFKDPAQSPGKCLEQQQLALQDEYSTAPKQTGGGMLLWVLVFFVVFLASASYWLLKSRGGRRWSSGVQAKLWHMFFAPDEESATKNAGNNGATNAGKQGAKNAGKPDAGSGAGAAGEPDGMNSKNAHANALDPRAHWYKILCVAEHSSGEEIKKAYKRMIGQYHPDKVEQLGAEIRDLAQSKTKQINIAYDHAMKLRKS